MIKKRYFFFALLLWLLHGQGMYAQYSREFWFAAPDLSPAHCDEPVSVRMVSGAEAAVVTISQPANLAFTPVTFSIPAYDMISVDLTPYKAQLECNPAGTVLNYGLFIESTAGIQACYDVTCNNTDVFILKGRHALGKRFVIPMQQVFGNGSGLNPQPVSSFSVVATEDNTLVTIVPAADIVGHAAGIPFTVVLNKGQVYAAAAVSNLASGHPGGSIVTADKPIAVTFSDDSVNAGGTCLDLCGDQLVPEDLLGTEYIVTGGLLSGNGDYVFVYAIADNTPVYINGNPVPDAQLDRGEYHFLQFSDTSVYIRTGQPVYVTHVTGFGCEVAQALIPPLHCAGSREVVLSHPLPVQSFLLIVVAAGAEGSFTVNGNNSIITPAAFSPVPGTGGSFMGGIVEVTNLLGNGINIHNALQNFQLGVVCGGVAGSNYGIISNFGPMLLDLGRDSTLCPGTVWNLDPGNPGSTYLWQDGSSNQTFPVSQPGHYSVTVTGAYGCTDADSVFASYYPGGTVTWNNGPMPVCAFSSAVSLSGGEPAGGTYSGPGVSNAVFDPATGAGSHTLYYTAIDQNACQLTDSVTLTVFPLPEIVIPPFPDDICIGLPEWSLPQAEPPGGTYSGNGISANTFYPAIAGTGTHSVTYTLTDGNGCTNSQQANLSVHPLPVVTFGGVLNPQCVSSNTYLLSGGDPPGGSYAGNGVNGGVFNASLAGTGLHTITYTYTDANSCTASASNLMLVYPLPEPEWNNPPADLCVTSLPLLLEGGEPSGGVYSGTAVSNGVFYPSIAGAGLHYLHYAYTDANGCSNVISVGVMVHPLPQVYFFGSFPPVCLNATPVPLNTGFPAGGTYSGPGVTAGQFNPALAGPGSHVITYTFADNYGCAASAQRTFIVHPLPVASAQVNPGELCEGEMIQFTGNASAGSGGGYTYQWTGPVGFITNLQHPQIISPVSMQSGTYTLVVRDGNNCYSAPAAVNVLIKPNPVPLATATPVVTCAGGEIQLQASATGGSGAGYQYVWTGPEGFSSTSQYPILSNVQPAVSGTYFLAVTDGAGCESLIPASVSITVHSLPLASAATPTPSLCEGSNLQLNGFPSGGSGAGYSFAWSGPGGFASSLQNPLISSVTSSNAGTYHLNVTDGNACTSSFPAVVNITVHSLPLAMAAADPDVMCEGAVISLNGNASGGSGTGYSYAWSGPAGYTASSQNPLITGVQVSQSGAYSLTVTDANACSSAQPAVITITVHENPSAQILVADTAVCSESPLQFSASVGGGQPPYVYQWSGPSGFSSSEPEPFIASVMPSQQGTYFLVVTDDHACVSAIPAQQEILVLENPQVAVTASQAVFCQGETVTVSATVSGGNGPPYGYQWTGPDGFSSSLPGPFIFSASVSSTGYYVLTLSDENSCMDKDFVLITVHPSPQPEASSNSPLCEGANLNLSASPGALPEYQWSGPGGFTSSLQNPVIAGVLPSAGGTYTVTVTNAFDCSGSASVNVQVNPLPVALAGPDQTINYGTYTTLAGSSSACGSNCSVNWQPAAMLSGPNNMLTPQTVNLTALQAYTLFVTNNQTGCISKTDTVIVNVTGFPLTVNPLADPDTICQGSSTQLQAQAGGGNQSYTYTWSPVTGLSNPAIANPLASPAATTLYSLTVSDGFNQVSGQLSIVVNNPVELYAGPDTLLCEGASLFLQDAGVQNASQVQWTTLGDGTFNNASLVNATYTPGILDIAAGNVALVLEASGLFPCPAGDDTVSVSISAMTVAFAGTDDTICAGGQYPLQQASVVNAGNVLWSTSGTGFFNNPVAVNTIYYPSSADITTGMVTLSLHASNPAAVCNDSTDSILLVIKPLPLADAGPDLTLCTGDTVQLSASGGGTYQWTPAAGLSAADIPDPFAWPSVTTTYALLVTQNGCSKTDSVKLTVRPLPQLRMSPDTFICPGEQAMLWASGALTYVWNDGNTDSVRVVSPSFSTYYYVTAANQYGCEAEGRTGVFVNPAPVLTIDPAEASICNGDFTILTAQGAATYHWSPASGLSSTTSPMVMASPGKSTTYTVTGTSPEGCQSQVQVHVAVYPRPELNLPDSLFLCDNETVNLNAGWEAGFTYQWQDGNSAHYYIVNEPGTYWVMASNQGCHVEDTTYVLPCTVLWVPSAFTPDGNGLNENFLVKSSVELLEYRIMIFTRWGELVYDSDDIFAGWDGKFQGDYCAPGVYGWVIYYRNRDTGKQLLKGVLTLVR